MPLTLNSYSVDQTHYWGKCLSRILVPGDILALIGELGSGKTELVRGVCQGLGVSGTIFSPSFVRVHRYQIQFSGERDNKEPQIATRFIKSVYHADFYLAKSPQDVKDYDLEELASTDAVIAIEWADLYPDDVPSNALWIYLEWSGKQFNQRRITCTRLTPGEWNFVSLKSSIKM